MNKVNKIDWEHAQKKNLLPKIAEKVAEHDAATATEAIHLRVAFAIFIITNYLHIDSAPCVYCKGNIAFMDEARAELAKIEKDVPTADKLVDVAPKKTKEKNVIKETE